MMPIRWAARAIGLVSGALAGCSDSAHSPAAPAGTDAVTDAGRAVTWYRDIEPLVQKHCNSCHYEGGIGTGVFTAETVGGVAGQMATLVSARQMPPWPPGPMSAPLVGARVLGSDDIALMEKWAQTGATLGDPKDHRDLEPDVTFDPGRPFDVEVMMSGDNVYHAPSDGTLSDEVRCFVIDLPPGTPNSWVTALNWVPGQAGAIHHIGGLTVDAASAVVARSFYGRDGRAGYECAGGFGDGVQGNAGFSASGAGKDTGTIMPEKSGIFVPAGSSVILSVHYILANIKGTDASGVQLWFAPDGASAGLRPMVQYTWSGPSELPCPTGVTTDPNDRCSRDFGINQVLLTTPDKTKSVNDYLLKKCGTTLGAYYGNLTFNAADTSHFYIPTECESEVPYDGVVEVVHSHMHTRGASARIEAMSADGSWQTVLDIPTWQWQWEGAYSLAQGVPVNKGQKLRLSCRYDNGDDDQWSLSTHQPGQHGPAVPPLELPHYVVAGPERGDDMCAAFLTIQRSPYKGSSYTDACHEAQAMYDDLCADRALNLLSGPCTGKVESTAVELVETTPAAFQNFACGPKGAASTVGATCDLAMNCAIACGAVSPAGFVAGIPEACATACKKNVNQFGKTAGQASRAASPLAAFRYDALAACAKSDCAGGAPWQTFLDCMEVSCTDVAQFCYGK